MPYHSHPLASLSTEQRDKLLETIVFTTSPRKYHMPDTKTTPFPFSEHIVNYSQLLPLLPEPARSTMIPLHCLKNGDIIQFSDYRECSTFYCLWLSKDIIVHNQDVINECIDAFGDSDGMVTPFDEANINVTEFPFDFKTSFMPAPIPIKATTTGYPRVYPRDAPEVSEHGDFHCYLFSHVDEYGFKGTSMLSMASEFYHNAIKLEQASTILLDPLMVHSKSYYGRVVELYRTSNKKLSENPYFPQCFIAEIGELRPFHDPDSESYDDAKLAKHLGDITWVPIDLAQMNFCTGGSRSSIAAMRSSNTETESYDAENLFYEMRNVLYIHFEKLGLIMGDSQDTLPLCDSEWVNCEDKVVKTFLTHTTELKLKDSPYEMFPSLYVEQAYQLFAKPLRQKLMKEVAEKQGVDNPNKLDYKIRQVVEGEITTTWNSLAEEEKKIYTSMQEQQQMQADMVQRDFPLYNLYSREYRDEIIKKCNPEMSWFQVERELCKSWMDASNETRQLFKKLSEARDEILQLAKDVHSIRQTVSTHKFMDKVRKSTQNPVAVAANALASAMTEANAAKDAICKGSSNEQQSPPQPVEEEYIIPPSSFTFVTSSSNGRSTYISNQGRRPPKGFIAYVLLGMAKVDMSEIEIDNENDEEDDEEENENESDNESIRAARIWVSMSSEDIETWIQREDDLEKRGQEQEALRKLEREQNPPPPFPSFAGITSFGGALGHAVSPPAAPAQDTTLTEGEGK